MSSSMLSRTAPSKRVEALRNTNEPPTTKSEHNRYSLDTLYEVSKLLAGPVDQGQMLHSVLSILASCIDLRHGSITLLSETENTDAVSKVNPHTTVATACGDNPDHKNLICAPERVTSAVLKSGIAVVLHNVAEELAPHEQPHWIGKENTLVSLYTVPIEVHEYTHYIIGTLTAFRVHEEGGLLQPSDDLKLLKMVAGLMGPALRFRQMIARDRDRLLNTNTPAEAGLLEAPRRRKKQKIDSDIVGTSDAMQAVIDRIQKVAPTRSTVLLRGESGTGKELFARAVHRFSDRKDKPFIKVNCAALSETLLESELFGHEKGAFTGAAAQKKGRFELADGGTLFLDEIGEISPSFQAKLLRALQENEFERVGGTKTVKVDVRLVAATNKDLEEAVANGDFRADLYFRICVIPIMLPPLRERREDIPNLAQSFLDRFNEDNGTGLRFSTDSLSILKDCYFPGNVRELENCVNRLAALSQGPEIEADDLACQQDACLSAQLFHRQNAGSDPIGGLAKEALPLPVLKVGIPGAAPCPAQSNGSIECSASQAGPKDQRQELIDAMEASGWVQAKAARLLGMTPRQIGYALKKHRIEVKKF